MNKEFNKGDIYFETSVGHSPQWFVNEDGSIREISENNEHGINEFKTRYGANPEDYTLMYSMYKD